MWIAIILIIGALIAGILLSAGTGGKQEIPTADVPEVKDGRKIGRIYGTFWIHQPQVLAFRQVGTERIKSTGGK